MFTVGSVGYWRIGLRGGNISLPGILPIEDGAVGVDRYSIFAANARNWSIFFDYFTAKGYGLLENEVIPAEGIVLSVEARTQGDAERFAAGLGSILEAGFIRMDLGLRNYTFYSHTSFQRLIEKYFWVSIPYSYGGVTALLDRSSFVQEALPMFSFRGERSGAAFTRSLAVSGVKFDAVVNGSLRLENLFGEAAGVNASAAATSSRVSMIALGSLASNFTGGNLENDPDRLRAVFRTDLSPGAPVPQINITLVELLPVLSATRFIDVATPSRGQEIEVRLRIQHLSPGTAPSVAGITIKEDWWQSSFEKVSGTTETTVERLNPGGEVDLSYRLRVATDAPAEVTSNREDDEVPYRYTIGNTSLVGSVSLNPVSLRLNALAPVLRAEASADVPHPPAGANASTTLFVTNLGSRTAEGVRAYLGETLINSTQQLLPGQLWNVSGETASPPLAQPSRALRWRVVYLDGGAERSIESNSVELFYRPSGPLIANLQLEKQVDLRTTERPLLVNVTLTLLNLGFSSSGNVVVQDLLPQDARLVNGSLVQEGPVLTASVGRLDVAGRRSFNYWVELAEGQSYVIPPAVILESDGTVTRRLSNSAVLPLGVVLERTVSLDTGFVGSVTVVAVKATNRGALPLVDLELMMDQPVGTVVAGNTSRKDGVLRQGQTIESRYTARFTEAGRFNGSGVTLHFFLSGERENSTLPAAEFEISDPLALVFLMPASGAVERRPLRIGYSITNPSALPVENVTASVELPPELHVLEGSLDAQGLSLGPLEVLRRDAVVSSDRSLRLTLGTPTLTFSYAGQQLQGEAVGVEILVSDDVVTRYLIPVGGAFAVLVAVSLVLRRVVSSSSKEPSLA